MFFNNCCTLILHNVYTASHTWHRLHLSGTAPSTRNSHSAVVASVEGSMKMLVFGGSSPNDGPLNDVHMFDLDQVEDRIASGAADLSEGISWEQPVIR